MKEHQLQLIHPNFDETLVYYLEAKNQNQIVSDVSKSLNNGATFTIFDTDLHQWVIVPHEFLKASIIHVL